jgi:AcrR family transcriptional regulator
VAPGTLQEPICNGDVGAFLGDQHPRGQVQRDACTTDERQRDEDDPHKRHVDGKVPGEPRGDAAEDPSLSCPPEEPGLLLVVLVRIDVHEIVPSVRIVSGALNTDHCTLSGTRVKSAAYMRVRRSQMWQTWDMATTTGLRARVRAELVKEIKQEARRQVAQAGAPALSLRAVARQLGMASSAIYRYFPSRDEMLTALIIDAYDAIGAATEVADATCERQDFAGRWRADCNAVRNWALEHPHEYALVYGSPIPGYRAPQDTIGPASRVTLALAAVVRDAAAAGALRDPFVPECAPALSTAAAIEAQRLGPVALPGVPEDAIVRALVAWTQLFGIVSFELFGHLAGVVEDINTLFDQAVTDVCAFVGIAMAERPGDDTA